jgi:transposase-like protein
MLVKINGEMHYFWQAVDHEGDGVQKDPVWISVAFVAGGTRN